MPSRQPRQALHGRLVVSESVQKESARRSSTKRSLPEPERAVDEEGAAHPHLARRPAARSVAPSAGRCSGSRPALAVSITPPSIGSALLRAGRPVGALDHEWHTSCTQSRPTPEEIDHADWPGTNGRRDHREHPHAHRARGRRETHPGDGKARPGRWPGCWPSVAPRLAIEPPRRGATPRPLRRDAAKRLSRATDDAPKWSDQTWRRAMRPASRTYGIDARVALGAAGAAVPAGRELVDTAAVRLGLRRAGGAPLGRLLPRPAARGSGRGDRRALAGSRSAAARCAESSA